MLSMYSRNFLGEDKKCSLSDKCDDNSYFDEEGKCISVKYCSKEGNYSKCIKCNEGYFLDEYNNSCTKEEKCKYGDKDLGLCFRIKLSLLQLKLEPYFL